MRIVGMMAAREESWVLNLSIRAALSWCDHLVVLIHTLDEKTRKLVLDLPEDLQKRMTPMVVKDPKWDEMAHRQAMIDVARREEPTHLAIVDADEVASVPLRRNMQNIASMLKPGQITAVPLKNLRNGWNYHANGLWGANRQVSVLWADTPAMRYAGDTFHSREPLGNTGVWFLWDQAPVVHFWGYSERRLVAKHKAYKVTERLRWPEKRVEDIEDMYNWATLGMPGEVPSTWRFEAVPQAWIPDAERALVGGDEDLWQEAYVREMIAEHGRAYFEGLTIE